jgi:hypothetical protein
MNKCLILDLILGCGISLNVDVQTRQKQVKGGKKGAKGRSSELRGSKPIGLLRRSPYWDGINGCWNQKFSSFWNGSIAAPFKVF